jgi:signal transduction histidine kinase
MSASSDSTFDTRALDSTLERLQHSVPGRWIGWRRRALALAAVLGCVLLFLLARTLAEEPHLDATWRSGPAGEVTLVGSTEPALRSAAGEVLVGVSTPGLEQVAVDDALLHRSARWQVSDALRQRQLEQQHAVAARLAAGREVTLHFRNGGVATVPVAARGYLGLGWLFWPLAGAALLLLLFGAVLMLARPDRRNLLFLVMCVAQAGNLAFVAAQSMPGMGWPLSALSIEAPLRFALDGITAAAGLQACALHPRRLPQARWIGAAGWAVAALGVGFVIRTDPPGAWWWVQGACAGLGVAALAVTMHSYHLEPNPFVVVMRRFMLAVLAVWLLVTVTLAVAANIRGAAAGTAAVASALWTLFIASLLLLTPFLARSQQVLREFAILAGISTVATSLDLLFAALFSLGPFASLTLAVFLALGAYAGVRQWLLNQMTAGQVLTTERTFEQIYRMAREVQARPARYPARAAKLVHELFDPLEMLPLQRRLSHARVVGNGSALVVPIPAAEEGKESNAAVVLRFARRGQRLFTPEDARLADRVIEQLRRAVAYDSAMERGRTEERLRIAQDLHDDIGARLLTLMYQAQTPEMEDYIRHTLKDLKTLSRGLATGEHRLSYAAAEWKADLAQRLAPAHVQLGWTFNADHDLRLSVVQWSALTRVLRELVSNALAHAQATRIDVSLSLEGRRLALSVADDGHGRAPQGWSHGLGLGGVRKRVKQLGGEVRWREGSPAGIVCEVLVRDFVGLE